MKDSFSSLVQAPAYWWLTREGGQARRPSSIITLGARAGLSDLDIAHALEQTVRSHYAAQYDPKTGRQQFADGAAAANDLHEEAEVVRLWCYAASASFNDCAKPSRYEKSAFRGVQDDIVDWRQKEKACKIGALLYFSPLMQVPATDALGVECYVEGGARNLRLRFNNVRDAQTHRPVFIGVRGGNSFVTSAEAIERDRRVLDMRRP